jgi:hypothetical protein
MSLGKGKTEHSGPRDMARKSGHWGFTEEAKAWATRARRRDEDLELRRELDEAARSVHEGFEHDDRAAERQRDEGGYDRRAHARS